MLDALLGVDLNLAAMLAQTPAFAFSKTSVFSFVYTLLLSSLRNVTSGLRRPSPLTLRRGPRGYFRSECCTGGESVAQPRVNSSLCLPIMPSTRLDRSQVTFPLSCACAVLQDHLRSEISFSRTCNILNLIRYIYRIALLTLLTLHCLCFCMVTQLHALRARQRKHLLSVELS